MEDDKRADEGEDLGSRWHTASSKSLAGLAVMGNNAARGRNPNLATEVLI